MRRWIVVLGLLAFAAPAPAQQLPPITAEGKKAAWELLNACVKAGALKLVKDPRTGSQQGVVADQAKLKEAARQLRQQFTPAARDALLWCCDHPGAVALLLRLGEEVGDERAVAFGQFFSARLLQQRLAYREARQVYEQAARLFERLKLVEWRATSLNNLAAVCEEQGDLSQARKLFEQTLALTKQLHGDRHPLTATLLNNLAAVCHDQGDLPQARKLHEQALALRKQLHGDRHPEVTNSLNNLAGVYLAQGDLPQSRKLFEQALALRKQLHGDRHPDVATSLNNLALVCEAQGDLPQARKLQEQALALHKQLHGDRHPAVAASLNNLAVVYRAQGYLPQARKLTEQALALRKQLHGDRHPDVADSLNNLAAVCREQGDLPQARKLFEQALALRKHLHGDHHRLIATSLNNLALVCEAQGDLPRARKLHEQALALYQQFHGDRHPAVATSLNNLGVVCRAQGNLPQATRHHTEAALACRLPGVERDRLANLRADDLTATADTVVQLQNLGWLLATADSKPGLERLRQASQAYALAAGVLDRLRAGVLQDEGKLDQGARRAALVPARIGLAAALFRQTGKAEDLHVAFTALEQGRGRVFLEALARARAHQVGGVRPDRHAREADLRGHLRGLDAAIARENQKTLDQRNADLVKELYQQRHNKQKELDDFAAQLRRDYPQYAALQYPRPCTLGEARACLGDNEVAVLFALDQKESYAVVVHKKPDRADKGAGVAVVALPGSDLLGTLAATLADAEVLKSDSRCRLLGARLYDLLLKPLAAHVQGKDLVLAPDGLLWQLPFELLVEGRTPESDGKYLIESRQVRYTPSMTVLHLIEQWQAKRKAPAEPLWALGDPVFSKDDPRAKGDFHKETQNLLAQYAQRTRGGSTWARLPATGVEVQAIADLHKAQKDDVVTGTRANEQVLKMASDKGVLARKRYLHLATHGILGSALGRPPSLVLSLVGNDGQEQLGGVNDGFLTMQEVTHLKLNADLVVLSACETGKGELIASEGIVGLSRAFLYAGSRGVVCSLWQVDDERTAELMKALYTELKGGKVSSAEALARARRKLIAQEQAPFYWTPFILIGR